MKIIFPAIPVGIITVQKIARYIDSFNDSVTTHIMNNIGIIIDVIKKEEGISAKKSIINIGENINLYLRNNCDNIDIVYDKSDFIMNVR